MRVKINPSKLPAPRLDPTKPVRVDWRPPLYIREPSETHRERRETIIEKRKRGGKHGGGGRPTVWTPERTKVLKELYLSGKSYKDMADHFKVSERSIMNRISALVTKGELERIERPTSNAWTNEEVSKLIELSSRGLYPREIAPHIGRTVGACSSKLSELVKQGKVNKKRRAYNRVIH